MLALISGLFAQLFSETAAYYVAIKVVLTTLFLTILPIILNNFFKSILDGVLSLITSYTGSVSPLVASFTGMAGWLANELNVPACFAVIFSAIALKVTLRCIPFVRL